ncbi:GGDEF domain-containing protein [Glaciecola sp. XM2]|uniref:GGDEF domain-containing protein n=1 Tax=Glaciecola sp. XM2 TaxID=1914931 RepID=UPI001BDF50B3|nr:GGDEF domain-containing protein [Glaciecola sp. XM2]MBT1450604.1 GGDEF domain-containing protein [Glaciecola sp. XM2]
MNFELIKQHWMLAATSITMFISAVLVSVLGSESTSLLNVEWSDAVGEGSVVMLTVVWTVAVLISRPAGKVTSLLVLGLNLFTFSALLDFFDEFTEPGVLGEWISVFESLPAAMGMVIMSFALYGWHKEQVALNGQLRRRELNYRQHQDIDTITLLYRANYFQQRAQQLIDEQKEAALIVVDVVKFTRVNRQFGLEEGDRVLREIAQLLLMNIRNTDLACRYAGDRFILLLPGMSIVQADVLAKQIQHSIESVVFKPNGNALLVNRVRCALGTLTDASSLEQTLRILNQSLDKQSERAA